jgi:predicted RNase H-like HicB family nuclease
MDTSPGAAFTAIYERDPAGDAWLVRIDGIDGCHTYGRTRAEACGRIREALAVWLSREPDGLTITTR